MRTEPPHSRTGRILTIRPYTDLEQSEYFMLYSAHAIIAQLVEHIHGKDEVISSILINGSKTFYGARIYELPLRSREIPQSSREFTKYLT